MDTQKAITAIQNQMDALNAEIDRLTDALEEAEVETKRLHDLHFERTKLTHKVLLDVEKRGKRIKRLEAAIASVGLSTPLPQSTVDLIYECRQLTTEEFPCAS